MLPYESFTNLLPFIYRDLSHNLSIIIQIYNGTIYNISYISIIGLNMSFFPDESDCILMMFPEQFSE